MQEAVAVLQTQQVTEKNQVPPTVVNVERNAVTSILSSPAGGLWREQEAAGMRPLAGGIRREGAVRPQVGPGREASLGEPGLA